MPVEQVTAKTSRLLVPAAALLITVIFLIGLTVPQGWALGGLYVAPVALVSLWSSSRHFFLVVLIATVCSGLSTAVFFFSPYWSNALIAITCYGLPLGIIWLIAILSLLRKSVERRTRRLKRFLTICASCKQVRSDQGSWSLERYIQDHPGTLLSLGVCSECAAKMRTEYRPSFQGHST
jgi:hypothetical protein